MSEHDEIAGYTIQVRRTGAECIASIPELSIVAKGETPAEALAAALSAEAVARQAITESGMSAPAAGRRLDPVPGMTGFLRRNTPFVARVLVGYVIVLGISGLLLGLAYPSVRAREESYLASNRAAADAQKIASRLGLNVCVTKP